MYYRFDRSAVGTKKYLICRIIMFLALCQCLIILICQFAAKDNFLYLKLRRMNLIMYLPSSYQQNNSSRTNNNIMLTQLYADTASETGEASDDSEPQASYSWLINNPVFRQFNMKIPTRRKRVTVLIIVSSGPRRIDRRQAIRDTWWVECKKIGKVTPECIFMTDYLKPTDSYYNMLLHEDKAYGDIRFQNVAGGVTFGYRMLNHMLYALTNYEFDYFMRMDDDNFFCLENYLREVPLPMIKQFHWGWVHCIPGITRPEESVIMFSHDMILQFLTVDPLKLLCHPWADQMIASWSNLLDMTYLFRHDVRIHHDPIVSKKPELRRLSNVCKDYLSIHGTYPDDMRLFWKHRGPKISDQIPLKDLFRNSEVCPIRMPFDWKIFTDMWRYEPKLCINNPTWNTSTEVVHDGSYKGRGEEEETKT